MPGFAGNIQSMSRPLCTKNAPSPSPMPATSGYAGVCCEARRAPIQVVTSAPNSAASAARPTTPCSAAVCTYRLCASRA